MTKASILVIEDEVRYRDLLKMNLVRRGYRVLTAEDGLTGLNLLESEAPDLVILDLMLPDLDGYDVCRRIRRYSTVPIVVLTAKSDESHKVRGLRMGADDYVTKPFGAEELLARVEAVLRRSNAAAAPALAIFKSGALEIDFARCRVTQHEAEVKLTPAEYKLLTCLAHNAGRVLVHDELLRRVWGHGYVGEVELLHTAVRRLRRKIEGDPSAPRYVLTKRGIGYSLVQGDPSAV